MGFLLKNGKVIWVESSKNINNLKYSCADCKYKKIWGNGDIECTLHNAFVHKNKVFVCKDFKLTILKRMWKIPRVPNITYKKWIKKTIIIILSILFFIIMCMALPFWIEDMIGVEAFRNDGYITEEDTTTPLHRILQCLFFFLSLPIYTFFTTLYKGKVTEDDKRSYKEFLPIICFCLLALIVYTVEIWINKTTKWNDIVCWIIAIISTVGILLGSYLFVWRIKDVYFDKKKDKIRNKL